MKYEERCNDGNDLEIKQPGMQYRYFVFRNQGFDVLAGAAFGIASAWFSFWVFGRNAFMNI
jgi:hypothetical protein